VKDLRLIDDYGSMLVTGNSNILRKPVFSVQVTEGKQTSSVFLSVDDCRKLVARIQEFIDHPA